MDGVVAFELPKVDRGRHLFGRIEITDAEKYLGPSEPVTN